MKQKSTPLIITLLVCCGGLLSWGVSLRSNARSLEKTLDAKSQELDEANTMIDQLKQQVRTSGRPLAPPAPIDDIPAVEPEPNQPLLVRREDEPPPPPEQSEEERREARRQEWSRSMQDRIEEMKKNNPEQYAEMQERMESRRQEATQQYNDRITFLSSLDTANLSPELRANHENLLARLTETHQAFEKMMADPFSEENRNMGRQLWEGMHEMNDMMKVEKQILLHDLASQAGYSGDKAAEFVEYIDYVDQMTTLRPPRGGRGPGDGFFGGGRGGPGGGGPGGDRGPGGGR